jgi:hypothetical protein
MVQLKVDAEKLPKADAIRERLFLSTFTVAVSDQDIRFTMRKAFPNLFNWTVIGLSASLSAAESIRQQMQQYQQSASPGQAPAPAVPPGAPGPQAGGRGLMIPGAGGPGAGGAGAAPGPGGGGTPGRTGGRRGRPGE